MNNHWVGMKLNNLHLSKRALDSAINSNFVIPIPDRMLEKNSIIFLSLDFYIPAIFSDSNINCCSAKLLIDGHSYLNSSEDRLSLPTCGIRNVPTCKGARYQCSSLSHGWWKLNGRTQRPRIPKWLSHSLAEWLQLPIEWLLLLASVLKSTDSQRWTPSFPPWQAGPPSSEVD